MTVVDPQYLKLTKISDKNCRVIIDSESCVNVVTSNMVTKFGLNVVPHPQPYSVLGDPASIDVKKDVLS